MPHLSFPVDADDAGGGLVRGGDKDGVATDAVHVDAGTGLDVVQVDVAVLGDHVDHVVFGANLQTDISKPLHYAVRGIVKWLAHTRSRLAWYVWHENMALNIGDSVYFVNHVNVRPISI